jgi:SAM-dependent methyltransferase
MPAESPYDEIPYASFPHAPSHPDQLAVVALLHGLDPPAPATARVLELGCGYAENAIGIAYGLPRSRVLGIDLASTPIEFARVLAAELELVNAEFRVADLRELAGGGLGEFDYVIAHGVYAWVDAATRSALIDATAAHLAPGGIGFISFNAHPGGHFRRALRELGQWYARDVASPAEQADRARILFAGLARLRGDSDPYGAMLAAEVPKLAQAQTDHLVHDLLNQDWEPAWFSQFAADVAARGLQYVGEASFHRFTGPWEPDAEQALWKLAGDDRVAYHQLMDFMVWRRFREALVCHAGSPVSHHFIPARARALRFRPAGPLDGSESPPDPILVELAARAPHPVAFEALREQLGADPATLAAGLIGRAHRGRVTIHLDPPQLGDPATERPQVSRLARLQAVDGTFCTTLLGGVAKLDGPVIRQLLIHADGTRDRARIRADLVAAGAPELHPEQLDQVIHDLAAMGLLEPDR